MVEPLRITRAAYLESLEDFRASVRRHCAGLPGMDAEALYDLQLAVDEACTNIITHGYAGMQPGSIILELALQPGIVTAAITDFGHSFEPDSAPFPDTRAALEEREAGGFGLFFIRQSVDQMDYRVTEDGNIMTFTKYLSVGGTA